MSPILGMILSNVVSHGVGHLMDNLFGDKKRQSSLRQEEDQQRKALEEFMKAKERAFANYLEKNKDKMIKEASDSFYLERFYYVWEDVKKNYIDTFLFFGFIVIVLYEILNNYNNKE